MAKSTQKITLSQSRDIPFNKLVLSQANVRRIKAGVSIEELAEDIARRTLLQSLTVRPVLDDDGAETGTFEIPAGGRRYRALELLVKQKKLARTAPVPCVVRTEGLAEEDSLAENVQRAPLHPLDQFRSFRDLREKGRSEEEIAATFFVSVQVVKLRLKLAAVSPKLLEVYAEDGMTLDQLMAFTVNPNQSARSKSYADIGIKPVMSSTRLCRVGANMSLLRLGKFSCRLSIILILSSSSRKDQHDHQFAAVFEWTVCAQREDPGRRASG